MLSKHRNLKCKNLILQDGVCKSNSVKEKSINITYIITTEQVPDQLLSKALEQFKSGMLLLGKGVAFVSMLRGFLKVPGIFGLQAVNK